MIKFEETTIYFENDTQNYQIDFAKLIIASPAKFCKIFKGVLISIMDILSPETLQEFKLFALGIYEKITEGMNKKAILSQRKRVKFCKDAYNAFLNWDWLTEKYPDCVDEKGHIKEERLIRLLTYFRGVVRTNNYDGNFYIYADYAIIEIKSDYNPYNYDHFDIENLEKLKSSVVPEKSYTISKKQLRDILTMENKSFRIKNPRLAGAIKIGGICFDIDTVKKCCKESENDSVVITTSKDGKTISFDFGDFKLLIACKNPSIYESALEISPFCSEVKPEGIQEETTGTDTEIKTEQENIKLCTGLNKLKNPERTHIELITRLKEFKSTFPYGSLKEISDNFVEIFLHEHLTRDTSYNDWGKDPIPIVAIEHEAKKRNMTLGEYCNTIIEQTETIKPVEVMEVKAKEYNGHSNTAYIAGKPIRHKATLYEVIIKSFNHRQISTVIYSGGNCIGKIPKPKIRRFLQYMRKSENPLSLSFNGLSPPISREHFKKY